VPPDKVSLKKAAKLDLDAIGGSTADWLLGELVGLRGSEENQFPCVFGKPEVSPLRRLEIGDYVAIFSVTYEEDDQRVFWVERILLRSDFRARLDEKVEHAEGWGEPD
jgi:hypothetical protein